MLASVRIRTLSVLLCAAALSNGTQAQNPKLEGLLRKAPSPPNAISYVHVPSLKKLMGEANIPTNLSNDVEEVYLVSDLEISSMKPNWEAGYAVLDKSFDAETLAKAVDGYVDMIGETKVVWTPRQSYLVPGAELPAGAENRMGFLRPARRGLAADWLNSSGTSSIPNYLAAEAKQPEEYLSMLLAVNLKDQFSPLAMTARAKELDTLKGQDPETVGRLFSSIQGVSVIVGRRSLSECILSVEFGESPAAMSSIATALLDEILKYNGTAAPEVLNWKVSVTGNKLSFQGPISADTLDGLLGIFSTQAHAGQVSDAVDAQGQATAGGEPSPSQMVTASKEYFDKVNAYIERVRKYEAQSTGYRAKWDAQQANRIDEIPTLNVDPLAIDYGGNVAGMLRGNASAIQAGNVSAGQQAAGASQSPGIGAYGGEPLSGGSYARGWGGGYGGYYSGYGTGYAAQYARSGGIAGAKMRSYAGRYQVNAQTVISAQQRMAGFGSYKQIINQIDALTGQVRKALTAKYNVQF
jgi:hypothetical protein